MTSFNHKEITKTTDVTAELFTDVDKLNKGLLKKLSKEPHLQEINGETWHVNPLTGQKKIILDKNDNFVNEIGD